jgi:hypothetical protein
VVVLIDDNGSVLDIRIFRSQRHGAGQKKKIFVPRGSQRHIYFLPFLDFFLRVFLHPLPFRDFCSNGVAVDLLLMEASGIGGIKPSDAACRILVKALDSRASTQSENLIKLIKLYTLFKDNFENPQQLVLQIIYFQNNFFNRRWIFL